MDSITVNELLSWHQPFLASLFNLIMTETLPSMLVWRLYQKWTLHKTLGIFDQSSLQQSWLMPFIKSWPGGWGSLSNSHLGNSHSFLRRESLHKIHILKVYTGVTVYNIITKLLFSKIRKLKPTSKFSFSCHQNVTECTSDRWPENLQNILHITNIHYIKTPMTWRHQNLNIS